MNADWIYEPFFECCSPKLERFRVELREAAREADRAAAERDAVVGLLRHLWIARAAVKGSRALSGTLQRVVPVMALFLVAVAAALPGRALEFASLPTDAELLAFVDVLESFEGSVGLTPERTSPLSRKRCRRAQSPRRPRT